MEDKELAEAGKTILQRLTDEEVKLREFTSVQNQLQMQAQQYAPPRKEAHIRKVKNGFLVFGGYAPYPYSPVPEEVYCADLEQVGQEIAKMLA